MYNHRIPENASVWSFTDPRSADVVTGTQLTVAGPMPVLCSAGVVTPAGIELLRETGYKLEAEIIPYYDTADRHARMQALGAKGYVFIDQHAQPDPRFQFGRSWVDTAVLSYLNNKSKLSELVPAHYCPQRSLLTQEMFNAFVEEPEKLPVVIKAVTQLSCGGSTGVRLCNSPEQLRQAQQYFRSCDGVIIEEYIAMPKNLCLNYAIHPDGSSEYLGAAQQIIGQGLEYQGNWLGPDSAPPPKLITTGHDLMNRAWLHGYRGFAGFDAAVQDDDSFYIYDLNFRFNGSTTPLLLYQSLARQTGMKVAKYRSCNFKGDYAEMLSAIRVLREQNFFIPFSSFDPAVHGYQSLPTVSALIFGHSQGEVLESETKLQSYGFLVAS